MNVIPRSLIPAVVAIAVLFFMGPILGLVSQWTILVINVPLAFWVIVGGATAYVAMLYYNLYIRDRSKVVLTISGLRESASGLPPLAEAEHGGDPFAPMTVLNVGGGAASYFAIKDQHAVGAPRASFERLGDDVVIVYSPTQPVPGFFAIPLMGHQSDLLARMERSAFNVDPKSKSVLHYSVLDTLHGYDSEKLRQDQAFIINKFARSSGEDIVRSRLGWEAIVKDMRGLARGARDQTKREKLGKAFFGKKKEPDSPEERLS